jgi:hypothetical protein
LATIKINCSIVEEKRHYKHGVIQNPAYGLPRFPLNPSEMAGFWLGLDRIYGYAILPLVRFQRKEVKDMTHNKGSSVVSTLNLNYATDILTAGAAAKM